MADAADREVDRPVDDEQDRLRGRVGIGLVAAPPGETSTTYCEKVSANPDSGLAITQARVSRQCGSWLVTMSRMVPRGRTAYASVNTARSVVSSVWSGRPPRGT